MSSEDFFMYLTIALIVLIPAGARLYRYVTARRVERMLTEQFGQADPSAKDERRKKE